MADLLDKEWNVNSCISVDVVRTVVETANAMDLDSHAHLYATADVRNKCYCGM